MANRVDDKYWGREGRKCDRVVRNFLETEKFIINDRNYGGFGINNDLAIKLEDWGFNRWVKNGEVVGYVDKVLKDAFAYSKVFNSLRGKICILAQSEAYGGSNYEPYYVKSK